MIIALALIAAFGLGLAAHWLLQPSLADRIANAKAYNLRVALFAAIAMADWPTIGDVAKAVGRSFNAIDSRLYPLQIAGYVNVCFPDTGSMREADLVLELTPKGQMWLYQQLGGRPSKRHRRPLGMEPSSLVSRSASESLADAAT